MLSVCLPVFSKIAKRQLIKHEKFYLFDTGVYRELRPKGPLDRPSERDGIPCTPWQNFLMKLKADEPLPENG